MTEARERASYQIPNFDTAPPPPPLEPRVERTFVARDYVALLSSQTGVRLESFSQEMIDSMYDCADRNAVNVLFFGGRSQPSEPQPGVDGATTHTPLVPIIEGQLSDEHKEIIKKMVSIDNRSVIAALKDSITSVHGQITRRYNEVTQLAREINEKQNQMRSMKEKDTLDMTPEVEKIIRDGWYTLHSVTNNTISFTTPEIIISHIKEAAGINMKVNLGSFLVKYEPRERRIKVVGYNNNLTIPYDGDQFYVHPHVHASSNNVCWGNGSAVYTKAMLEYAPHKAFNALRTLLQTYNDESPYVRLSRFELQRNPSKVALLPGSYDTPGNVGDTTSYRYAWVLMDELPTGYNSDYYIDDGSDYDGNNTVKLGVFRYYHEDTNVLVAEHASKYYYKGEDGDIQELTEGMVYEWSRR